MAAFYLGTIVIFGSEPLGVFQDPCGIGQIVCNAPIQTHTEILVVGISNDTSGHANSRLLEKSQKIHTHIQSNICRLLSFEEGGVV